MIKKRIEEKTHHLTLLEKRIEEKTHDIPLLELFYLNSMDAFFSKESLGENF